MPRLEGKKTFEDNFYSTIFLKNPTSLTTVCERYTTSLACQNENLFYHDEKVLPSQRKQLNW